MARSFNGSSNNEDYGTLDPLGATSDWTAFAWMKPTASQESVIIAKRNSFSSGSDSFTFALSSLGGSGARNPVAAKNASFCVFTAQSYTAGAWSSLGFSANASGITSYLNGSGSQASTTNNLSPTSDWRTGASSGLKLRIGASDSTAQGFFNGPLAFVALWNVALNADEHLSLSKGINPRLVRPASLRFIDDVGPVPRDLYSGTVPTLSGTSASDNPRIYYS